MDFDLIALSPYCDQIWNIKNFLLAACLLLCIYLTVYLIHFKEKLVETKNFVLYVLVTVIVDAAFLFMCYSRLTFDDIFAMIFLAPLVYLFKEVFCEFFEFRKNK